MDIVAVYTHSVYHRKTNVTKKNNILRFETGNTLNVVKHKNAPHRTMNETATFIKLSVIILLFHFSNGEHNTCIWNIYLLTKYTDTRSSDWPMY